MSKTAEKPQLLLKHHLKQLKLPTFLAEYERQAQECAQGGVDHVRYLLRLAELELIERERRMVERRIRAAKFPAAGRTSALSWRNCASRRSAAWRLRS